MGRANPTLDTAVMFFFCFFFLLSQSRKPKKPDSREVDLFKQVGGILSCSRVTVASDCCFDGVSRYLSKYKTHSSDGRNNNPWKVSVNTKLRSDMRMRKTELTIWLGLSLDVSCTHCKLEYLLISRDLLR